MTPPPHPPLLPHYLYLSQLISQQLVPPQQQTQPRNAQPEVATPTYLIKTQSVSFHKRRRRTQNKGKICCSLPPPQAFTATSSRMTHLQKGSSAHKDEMSRSAPSSPDKFNSHAYKCVKKRKKKKDSGDPSEIGFCDAANTPQS